MTRKELQAVVAARRPHESESQGKKANEKQTTKGSHGLSGPLPLITQEPSACPDWTAG